MEAAPPSYQNATFVDFWDIVARYMPSRDLTAAALVCSRWHSTFAPHIWGNPASHFGTEIDQVHAALSRFGQKLQTARLLVRSLTHTLHMPPAHTEIYDGPHTDWLRDMLERLPNLQSFIVRGLPFFDHGALQALAIMRKQALENSRPPAAVSELTVSTGSLHQSPAMAIPSFGLRLLDASRCQNVTSSGLASALSRFEGLLYLDLSFTYSARSTSVLASLSGCRGLQVLKLRGIGLRDQGVEMLAKSIGRRVRSLDIRDNELTDQSARTLLAHCFTHNAPAEAHSTLASGQRSPSLLPYLGSEMLDVYQGEDFEGYLHNAFTGRFVSRLAIEDIPVGGITHLYTAGNELTLDGVSALVRSGRLHVLDAGNVIRGMARHPSSSRNERPPLAMSGGETLTRVLAKCAGESMTFLRIEHDLVTKEASHSHDVVAGDVEPDDTDLRDLSGHAAEFIHQTSTPTSPARSLPATLTTGTRSYSGVATDGRGRVAANKATTHNLHPAMLPRVRTLVLTDVPPYSTNRDVADRIICFVRNCAEEASLARSEAKFDYAIPPGRRGHASALKESATRLFALKRLVLELAPAKETTKDSSTWQHLGTKSMTEDRDSETLWSAAEADFSFFGDEKYVVPRVETGYSNFLSGENDKEAHAQASPKEPMVDNVAVVSAFRQERKSAHQQHLAAGNTDIETEGFWDGTVQVVRHNHALNNEEHMDYYGNMFTSNYSYR